MIGQIFFIVKRFLFVLLTIVFYCFMSLKFQSLINKLELNDCPSNVFPPPSKILAFRFSYEPIEHEHNFLPNYLLDEINNLPYNFNQDRIAEQKCLRCGTSFFLSQEAALKKWRKISEQIKLNMGYSHIAEGILEQNDGLMSNPKKNHFTFYQNEGCDLTKKFKNTYSL